MMLNEIVMSEITDLNTAIDIKASLKIVKLVFRSHL
jgi:hypothetical protein